MRSALAALLCLAASPAAATYPVEIDAKTNGLAIEVKASAGTPLVVTFVSKERRTRPARPRSPRASTPRHEDRHGEGRQEHGRAVQPPVRAQPRTRRRGVRAPPAVKSEAKTISTRRP
ncbi:MAG: hypothetical protein IPL06_16825 [Betaproteobacteria bacterium]|nr:hypothetical protein [Betaproteobacteria bacterium]